MFPFSKVDIVRLFPLYAPQSALVLPHRSIVEKWWESQNGASLDDWDSLRTTDGYCDDGVDGQFEAWNACCAEILETAKQNIIGWVIRKLRRGRQASTPLIGCGVRTRDTGLWPVCLILSEVPSTTRPTLRYTLQARGVLNIAL